MEQEIQQKGSEKTDQNQDDELKEKKQEKQLSEQEKKIEEDQIQAKLDKYKYLSSYDKILDEQCGGEEEMMITYLGSFLEYAFSDEPEIKNHTLKGMYFQIVESQERKERKDNSMFRDCVHKMKGNARSTGMGDYFVILENLQIAIDKSDQKDIDNYFAQFIEYSPKIYKFLSFYLEGIAKPYDPFRLKFPKVKVSADSKIMFQNQNQNNQDLNNKLEDFVLIDQNPIANQTNQQFLCTIY